MELGADPVTASDEGSPRPPTSVGPFVQVLSSPDRAQVGCLFTLGPRTVLGRGAEATVVLGDDAISRQHVEIVSAPGGFTLLDLDSRNGTWVNGERVVKAALRAGDRIQLGSHTVLRFSTNSTELRVRDVLASSRVCTWSWDPSTNLVTFSEFLDATLGLPFGSLGGAPRLLDELVLDGDRRAVRGALAAAATSRTPVEVTLTLSTPAGPRWLTCTGEAVATPEGPRVTGLVIDATERTLAVQELRRHALIFQNLDDGAVVLDIGGRVLDVNPAAEALLGRRAADALGAEALPLLGIAEASVDSIVSGVAAAGRWRAELEVAAADGRRIPCEVSAVPIRRDEHELLAVALLLRDVRERRQLLGQLALAERLASVGTLSAGLAHEINNPLTWIIGNLEFASAEIERLRAALGETGGARPFAAADADGLAAALKEGTQGARRIAAIVRDLRVFARRDESGTPAPVDVRRAVEVALEMCSPSLRHRAKLDAQYAEVRPVLGHEHRLTQVFVNLLVNAGQAIPDERVAEATITVRVEPTAGGHARVTIGDTGLGIPREVLRRIFDPFFTTRAVGTGTGLGLSIVHGIVTALGGKIEVDSEVGRGTTFTVELPTVDPVPRAAVSTPVPAVAAARVLVVDDEPLVVTALARNLRGHAVRGATSAQDAQRLLEREPFDCVLCDLMLPGTTGMELYEAVKARDPALAQRFVFMTGGAFTPRAKAFVSETKVPVLAKPLDIAAVRKAIARLLSQRS